MAFLVALALLLCGTALSVALAAEHLGQMTLPGCGPESACARLAATSWGSLPGVDWPLSFVGVAWFLGLGAAWLGCRREVPRALLRVVRLGAVGSLTLLAVMLVEHLFCGYCLALHAAHLAFCALAHRPPVRPADATRALVPLAATFALASVGLWAWSAEVAEGLRAQQERELAQSTAEIASGAQAPEAGPWPARHRRGPELAPVRIVVFSDFQCEDCKRVHADLERVLAEHADVSVSALHFPMCADCNPRFAEDNLHPNACWAARAAEAAGMLRGTQGYWDFSSWLFERDGAFTRSQLEEEIRREGYELNAFLATMEGEETLRRVRGDIAEGLRRGLHFTPMVFVNGIELQGVLAVDAIPRAVREVLATRPEAAASTSDVAVTALDKYVADWRAQPVRSTAPERRTFAATPPDARVEIVVWGDYQEQHTASADRILRNWAAARPDASYSFRHFPAHSGCNSKMKRVMHPDACALAQAAEAASLLGSEEQYWRMHAWLLDLRRALDRGELLRAAAGFGFDSATFEATMASREVADAIERDAQQGFPMLYHGSIPAIYINGKVVPRWRLEGHDVLETILDGLD